MPKKFASENTKAVAAKARKAAVKDEEKAKKVKDLEDAMWHDDNKHVQRKQQKKEDQDRKKQEAADRKAENKALLEQEVQTMKKNTSTSVAPPPKVTRAHISETLNKLNKPPKPKVETHLETPLEENLNRVVIEGEHAHSVEEAISVLSVKDDDYDKHPEKRMKAAYTEFEQRRLAELKEEKPTLRLSQLKQLIFREWQKSPDNPLNK